MSHAHPGYATTQRRRTWRLRLAAEWLAGTSFGILDIRHRFRTGTSEREVRRVWGGGDWRVVKRMSKGAR